MEETFEERNPDYQLLIYSDEWMVMYKETTKIGGVKFFKKFTEEEIIKKIPAIKGIAQRLIDSDKRWRFRK